MPESNNHNYSLKNIQQGIVYFVAGKGYSALLSFLFAVLLVRWLSLSDYAAYVLITGFMTLMLALSSGGLERVIPRFMPEIIQLSNARQFLKFVLFLGLLRFVLIALVLIIMVSLYQWKFHPYFNIDFHSVLTAFVVYTLLSAVNLFLSRVLQAMLEQKNVSIALALEWSAKLLILIGLAVYLYPISLIQVLWISSLSLLLSILFMTYCLVKYSRHIKQTETDYRFNISAIKQIAIYNYLQLLTGLPSSEAASKVIAGIMLSVSSIASFGFARMINQIFLRYLPSRLLLGLIEPVIVSRYNENGQFSTLNQHISTIYKINMFILAPATAWMVIAAQPVLLMITDGKYADSYLIISALMFVNLLESHRMLLEIVANLINKAQLLFISNILSLVIFPLLFLGMYYLEVYGLIAGLFLISLFRNYYIVFRIRSAGYHYQVDSLSGFKMFLVALASYSLSWWVLSYYVQGIILSIVILLSGSIIYLWVLYFYKCFNDEERQLLNRLSKRRVFIW